MTILDEYNIAATDMDETLAGGSSAAAGIFSIMMNTPSAYEAIHNGSLTHVGMGYTYNGIYADITDFWSVIYITAPASATPSADSSGSFTPVPMKELANLKSIQKKATDEQLAQAYNVALEIVRPLAGLSREEQLQGVAKAIRDLFDSGMDYSMTTEHYNDPYGYFILGAASCAGCTRATGLCLNILGIPYEHVNENQYSHQWCRVNVGGTYWICDAYGLYCGEEPSPYAHPYF